MENLKLQSERAQEIANKYPIEIIQAALQILEDKGGD